MKTYTNKEGFKVEELSFDDWEQGLITGISAPFNRRIKNGTTNETYYQILSKTEFDKILEASKVLYKEQVIARAVELRDGFYKKLRASEDKETLLKQELEKYEAILLPSVPLKSVIYGNDQPIKNSPYTAAQIQGFKKLYQQLIIDGNKDYSVVRHPNCQISIGVNAFNHIQTEAMAKLHVVLKNFNLNAFIENREPFTHATKMHPWDLFEINGFHEKARELGFTINPTHNFKMLLEVRQEIYEKRKAEFIADSEFNQTTLDNDDWAHFNRWHLEQELETAINWIVREKELARPSASNLVQLNKYKDYVQQQLAQPSTVEPMAKPAAKRKKSKPAPPKTLKDIWEGNDDSYDKLIKILKTNQPDIGATFVTEINGKLVWNKQPRQGFAQYLAGLFYSLIDKGLIKNQYSAPHITTIILNTFNISVDSKPFRALIGTPPNEIYTKPFKGLIPILK